MENGSPINMESHQEKYHSQEVEDHFTLHFHRPPSKTALPTLLYLDAHLPSGRKIPRLVTQMTSEGLVPELQLVGIGQTGSLFRKRNRDMIAPHRRKGNEFYSPRKGYGQAQAFYHFLTKELLPHIETNCAVNGDWALCGHSLGGLFALYALLQPDCPFEKTISLSPSVWVNRRNLLRIAARRHAEGHTLKGRLYMAAGSLEEFNFILPGMRAFDRWRKAVPQPELTVKTEELKWKNHFTVVKLGVRNGLRWIYNE